jgi:Gpi18-like mannosyltransferase
MNIAIQMLSQKLVKPQHRRQALILFGVSFIALLVRVLCFPFESRDYQIFLQPWFEEIKANGGFLAIGRQIGDYLPPYIYILAALSYLPASSLVSIKMISCLGDIIMACYAAKIVKLKTQKSGLAAMTYCVLMLLPTVVLNSGLWGQCDSLYTAALVACVYYMMDGKPRAGMIAFSIAFIFKLQAVFLAPFILSLFIKRKINFWHLF